MNEINQIDQTNQINQVNHRREASPLPRRDQDPLGAKSYRHTYFLGRNAPIFTSSLRFSPTTRLESAKAGPLQVKQAEVEVDGDLSAPN
jgi:hypothetical protein